MRNISVMPPIFKMFILLLNILLPLLLFLQFCLLFLRLVSHEAIHCLLQHCWSLHIAAVVVAICTHCRVDPKDCRHSHFWLLVILCDHLSLSAVWSKSSASNGHCTQLLSSVGSSTTVLSLCVQFGLHAFRSESYILFSWSLTVLMVHRVGWLHVNRSTIIGVYVFV